MMKRTLLSLTATLLLTSCTPLLYSSRLPIGEHVQTIARRLTPTEDPATGLYGYLSDIGLTRYQAQNALQRLKR